LAAADLFGEVSLADAEGGDLGERCMFSCSIILWRSRSSRARTTQGTVVVPASWAAA
jgi:hypothetical protein